MEKKEPTLISKEHLKKGRGWTEALINRFIPEPCMEADNPYYCSAPPMLLYSIDRVEAIEATEDFKTRKERADRRKAAARKAVATKTENLVEQMKYLDLAIPKLSQEELIQRYRGNSPNKHYTDRLLVNYLRHSLSHYDSYVWGNDGRTGKHEAYIALKTRVLSVIAEQYPWLAGECEKQRQRLTQLRRLL